MDKMKRLKMTKANKMSQPDISTYKVLLNIKYRQPREPNTAKNFVIAKN